MASFSCPPWPMASRSRPVIEELERQRRAHSDPAMWPPALQTPRASAHFFVNHRTTKCSKAIALGAAGAVEGVLPPQPAASGGSTTGTVREGAGWCRTGKNRCGH